MTKLKLCEEGKELRENDIEEQLSQFFKTISCNFDLWFLIYAH